MNGDHNSDTPESGWQYRPADNPPSLSEPSQPTNFQNERPAVSRSDDEQTPSQNTATMPGPVVSQPRLTDQLAPSTTDKSPSDDVVEDADLGRSVRWESSGEELQARSAGWRVRMTLLSAAAAGLVFLVTRGDLISSGSVLIVGLLFGILGSRRPQSLEYRVDSHGITIGQKYYPYAEFRAFSVIDDLNNPSINLVPLKRFMPVLSLHYDPRIKDRIVEVLAGYLPMEIPRRDSIDHIINRIKF